MVDSVEDLHADGRSNGKPAVLLVVFRQPGANIIGTVDRVIALLPHLRGDIPAGMQLGVVVDRTTSIRSSVRDVELTLLGAVVLVVLVVFAFLRDWRAALIPCVAVPVSLLGTFGVLYLGGYSIDNLSLMALTIATGFVVDDAIVVVENVQRYVEQGLPPFQAALRGAREIGFTVIAISLSLIAVFVPILFMGGIVGRLFREFGVTLSVAVAVSLVVSLTTTPMLCAKLLRPSAGRRHGRLYRASERTLAWTASAYELSLAWVLRHTRLALAAAIAMVALSVTLFAIAPKGFFPQQDTGRLIGSIVADQDASAQAMKQYMARVADVVAADPAVVDTVAFTGGSGNGRMFVVLTPAAQRDASADQVIARLRRRLASIASVTLYLQPVQDLQIGGRLSNAQYQYTLQGQDFAELATWAPRLLARLRQIPGLVDVNSDLQNGGRDARVDVDRDLAARLGLSSKQVDDELYDRFGQRQVSVTYTPLNQYHVVLEVDPRFTSTPDALHSVTLHAPGGAPVPLAATAATSTTWAPTTVAHQAGWPSVTLSFSLLPGVSLGDAVQRIEKAEREIGLPADVQGNFSGTAQAFMSSLASEPYLLGAALLVVYLVLGMLYESLIHPITILSTLPSAGVGALLALTVMHVDLSVIALIGIILLIGIVKKNAILMIDFAIVAQREDGLSPEQAIFQAAKLRFRPITMTTMAALLGALPLALGLGSGGELRRPLGIAIVGGLLVSQALTLYTTPVVYLYLERLRRWLHGRRLVTAAPVAALALVVAFVCGSCTVGPNYRRPTLEVPASYARGTQAASHLDPTWWKLFGDQTLNQLEASAVRDNPGAQAALARVVEARAAARIAGSERMPSLTFDPSIARAGGAVPGAAAAGGSTTARGAVPGAAAAGGSTTTALMPFDLSYEVDVWGKLRRTFESARAQSRASGDNYGVVMLTLTANVASGYFTVRSLDAQADVLARSVAAYQHQVELTGLKRHAGLVGPADLLQAQSLLDATLAQQSDVLRQRSDTLDALAILTGRPPSALSLEARPLAGDPPVVPAGVPSELLRRRPDVEAAEQQLIAASAGIGVARAALYPSFSLTGSAGVGSSALSSMAGWASLWSIALGVVQPIFEGGKLRAGIEQAVATYDEARANYRQTVLQSFADVESALNDLDHLTQSQAALQRAADASREAERLLELEYQNGLVDYLQVLAAEQALLTNELGVAQTLGQRHVSTVLLIKALGGGWSVNASNTTLRKARALGPSGS